MLTSPAFKKAFDLSEEPKSRARRYGRTTYGQGCLLARRLVEAGAKFVNVYFSRRRSAAPKGGWDNHGFGDKPMDPILKSYLLPITDQTLPTLIEDLEERGLLDDTLVVWVGEFGRTPRINANGRPRPLAAVLHAVLAGGGVKGGYVYGASDKIGAYPTVGQVRPEDLAATMFDLLGIDPETEIRDTLNRPLPISRGKVIEDVIA